jgi:hypothetical protein
MQPNPFFVKFNRYITIYVKNSPKIWTCVILKIAQRKIIPTGEKFPNSGHLERWPKSCVINTASDRYVHNVRSSLCFNNLHFAKFSNFWKVLFGLVCEHSPRSSSGTCEGIFNLCSGPSGAGVKIRVTGLGEFSSKGLLFISCSFL